MRKILNSLFCLFFLLSDFSIAEQTFPFVGRVTGSRVNVRAGDDMNSAVVTQLDKGKLVFVLQEDGETYCIEPPDGVTFWISSKFVREGWPKSDGVNVRSGAGTHYPVACKVDKNSSLDIVKEAGEWTEIVPPKGSTVKISKEYVAYFATPENYLAKLEEEKVSQELFAQAEDFRRQELNKPMAEINFDLILEKYQAIVTRYPGSPMEEKVQARVHDTNAKKEVAVRELEGLEMKKKRAEVKIPEATENKVRTVLVSKEPEFTSQSFEGLLIPVKQKSSQFTHQLQGGFLNTRRLCLLSAPDLNLFSYHNKKVRVWGKFVAAEVEGLSGVLVERVELVHSAEGAPSRVKRSTR